MSLQSWLKQPTTVAGLSGIVGTGTALLMHQTDLAHALPLIVGSLVAALLPDNTAAKAEAADLTAGIVDALGKAKGAATDAAKTAAPMLLALAMAAGLSACAADTGRATLGGLYATYNAAAAAELAYERNGHADPALVAAIDAKRRPAFAALHAAEQAELAGGSGADAVVAAAAAAIADFEAAAKPVMPAPAAQ